jgi:hypothetical protein
MELGNKTETAIARTILIAMRRMVMLLSRVVDLRSVANPAMHPGKSDRLA